MKRSASFLLGLALCAPFSGMALAAGGAHTQPAPEASAETLTPAERMARRFPQPVLAGALAGWPLLDYEDRVLGHVTKVVRSARGDLFLVVPVGGWFGQGGRPVAVPVEAVALIGRHVALLDIPSEDLADLPTWTGEGSTLAADETIRLAITRR